ncbi:MAG: hypothetical protein LEGION0398_MBIBDBAK_00950 [Legionellaceae bacterium]
MTINKSLCYRWCIWILTVLFLPYQFFLQASPSVMVPELIHAFSINMVDIGFLSSCFFYSYILLQVPSGSLIDRYGIRIILTLTILLCASACLLFAFSSTYFMAKLSRFLMGVAASTSVVSALSLATKWFPIHYFGLLAGLMEMLGMLGGAIGQATLAKGVEYLGWRESMMICGGIGFVLAFFVFLLVRDKDKQFISTPAKIETYPFLQQLSLIFKNKQLWINGMYCGLIFAILSGFAGLWSVPYLTACYDRTPTGAAYETAIMFIGAGVGGPLLGWLAGKFSCYKKIMLLCAIGALTTFSIILYVKGIPILGLFLLLFLLGFFSGAYAISFIVAERNISIQAKGAAMGFTNTLCIIIGAPIIQPLVGYWLGKQLILMKGASVYTCDHYQYALSPLNICLLLAIFCALLIKDIPITQE